MHMLGLALVELAQWASKVLAPCLHQGLGGSMEAELGPISLDTTLHQPAVQPPATTKWVREDKRLFWLPKHLRPLPSDPQFSTLKNKMMIVTHNRRVLFLTCDDFLGCRRCMIGSVCTICCM